MSTRRQQFFNHTASPGRCRHLEPVLLLHWNSVGGGRTASWSALRSYVFWVKKHTADQSRPWQKCPGVSFSLKFTEAQVGGLSWDPWEKKILETRWLFQVLGRKHPRSLVAAWALVAAWVPPQAGERSPVQLALYISWDLLRWHILWPRPGLFKETKAAPLPCMGIISDILGLGLSRRSPFFFFLFLSFKPLLALYWSPVISRFLACLGVQQPASVIWANLWCFSDSPGRYLLYWVEVPMVDRGL